VADGQRITSRWYRFSGWPHTSAVECTVSQPMPSSVACGHCHEPFSDLDAPALSKIMARRVTSVSVIGGDAGTSSRGSAALTGDDVPASVFVKMPPRPSPPG